MSRIKYNSKERSLHCNLPMNIKKLLGFKMYHPIIIIIIIIARIKRNMLTTHKNTIHLRISYRFTCDFHLVFLMAEQDKFSLLFLLPFSNFSFNFASHLIYIFKLSRHWVSLRLNSQLSYWIQDTYMIIPHLTEVPILYLR